MVVLQEFAQDETSPSAAEAIASVIEFSRGGDTLRATITLTDLLKSKDTAERIAAYQGLVAIHSQAVQYYSVGGGKFLLDVVPSDSPPSSTSPRATPRVSPSSAAPPTSSSVLYVSPDNYLTVTVADDAPAVGPPPPPKTSSPLPPVGELAEHPATQPAKKKTLPLYWRSPFNDRLAVELTTTSRIQDIIARLGWAPNPKAPGYDPKAQYIGASYQRIAEMLAFMCKDQTLPATFVLQKLGDDPFKTAYDIIGGARPEGPTGREMAPAPRSHRSADHPQPLPPKSALPPPLPSNDPAVVAPRALITLKITKL